MMSIFREGAYNSVDRCSIDIDVITEEIIYFSDH